MDFFAVSKIFWFLVAPSNLLVLLAALALILIAFGARRLSRVLFAASVLGLLVFGFSPAGNYIYFPLEERFPLFKDDGRPVDGVIMLGGAEVPEVGLARGIPAFADAGERAIAFADLARRYPQARLAFVGGSGRLGGEEGAEAKMIRASLPDLGIEASRVTFEDKSRNTEENAVFAKALLQPKPGERWLLVTSAAHMPRAMGCFRQAGFPVTAYPVDFRTAGPDGLWGNFSRAAVGLDFTDTGLKEWVGLVVYYMTGKTNALFPAP